ncbi:hypothetical protein BVC80_1717g58 [Macleaya cordata]|uniref:Nucleoporin n=1 Tax=Macleaya cordata TaxID=56857 RepID=A0A200Q1Y9_MACCD|nr:hypothetical protein BVC80_1717g58 [Macleaya cordata]
MFFYDDITAFGQPSSSTFGSSVSGMINNASSNPSPCGSSIELTPSQSSPYSSTFQAAQPTLVNNVVGSSTPFGASSQPAVGANRTPTSGSSSNFGFTISSSPPFSFGSAPALGKSISAFGSPLASGAQATTPTLGTTGFGFGQTDFGGQRRVPAYTPTAEIGTHPAGKLDSISAMSFYEGKSHEELRWEDYQVGDRAFGHSSSTQSGSSVFGQIKDASSNTLSCGSSAVWLTPSLAGKIFQQTQPALGSNLSGSSTGCGESSTPSFSYISTPAFRSSSPTGFGPSSTPSFSLQSTPSPSGFGTTSTPSFSFPIPPSGSSSPFGTTPSPFGSNLSGSSTCLDASSQPGFGATSTPALGSSSTICSGASSTPSVSLRSTPSSATGCGESSTPSFSYILTPAFRSSSPAGFGPSSTPSFSLQSTPSPSGFGTTSTPSFSFPIPPSGSSSPFGTTPSPFGDRSFPSGAQATAPTEVNGRSGAQPAAGKLVSLSAMPVYETKSHEELRWEDYHFGDYGGWAWKSADRCACGNGFCPPTPQLFPSGFIPVFGKKVGPTRSQSSPFGSTFGQTQPTIGSNLFGSSIPFAASIQPALRITMNPAFGSSSTPRFSVSSTPSFGFGSTPAFGVSTSAIDRRSPLDKTSYPFGPQCGGSRVAAYTPTTEVDVVRVTVPAPRSLEKTTERGEASTSRLQSKKDIENLRIALEVEREVERRVSQTHMDFLASILEKLDNLNLGEGYHF